MACAGSSNGRAKLSNLSWGVDAAEISAEFDIPHVSVLNDQAALLRAAHSALEKSTGR